MDLNQATKDIYRGIGVHSCKVHIRFYKVAIFSGMCILHTLWTLYKNNLKFRRSRSRPFQSDVKAEKKQLLLQNKLLHLTKTKTFVFLNVKATRS